MKIVNYATNSFIATSQFMKLESSEFALYIDDSVSPKPDPKDQYPFFGMGGVLISRGHGQIIETLVLNFKHR